MPSSVPKYRPAFSGSEIMELHHYLNKLPKELIREQSLYKKLLSKIVLLALKIDMGEASASYTMTPKTSLMEQLGGSTEDFPNPLLAKTTNYTKYIATPGDCTEEEILDALEYKEYTLKEKLTEEERDLIDKSWGM